MPKAATPAPAAADDSAENEDPLPEGATAESEISPEVLQRLGLGGMFGEGKGENPEASSQEPEAEAAEEEPAAPAEGEAEPAAEEEPAAEVEPAALTITPEIEAEISRRVEEATKPFQAKDGELATARKELADLQAATQFRHLDPLLLASPDALTKWEQSFRQFEDWATEHAEGVEASEDGKQPAISAAQIRQELLRLRRTAETALPQARQLIRERAQHDAAAKAHYPDLFDNTKEDYQIAEGFLRAVPQFRQFADARTMIGDSMLGQRLREGGVAYAEKLLAQLKAKAAKAGTAPGKPAASAPVKKAPPAAPHIPVRGAPSAGNPGAGKGGAAKGAMDAGEFIKRGGDRSALVAMLNGAGLG